MSNAPSPKISIIIPTLNAGALLDNCLASIAAQDYPRDRVEVILADADPAEYRELGRFQAVPATVYAAPAFSDQAAADSA